MTLGLLRLRYWIPRGRATTKYWLHRCITCTRWRRVTPQPPMGNLPQGRVTPARPFLRTGVDYAGPIFIRTSRRRGHRSHKAFVAIFVCLCSKATHLEVVSDYTTDAFLAALRRFTSRRGICSDIFRLWHELRGRRPTDTGACSQIFHQRQPHRGCCGQRESGGTSIHLPHLTSVASGRQR